MTWLCLLIASDLPSQSVLKNYEIVIYARYRRYFPHADIVAYDSISYLDNYKL